MSRLRCAAVTVLVAMTVLGGPAAVAAAAPPPAAPDEPTPVMVVLDASGSMKQADAPGPRIDAAKRAVTGLVAALPKDARVGLTVYGTGTGSGAADKAAGCQDIKQLIPVQPVDRAAVDAAVTRIRASGYTPIGRSLQQAAAALPSEGPRSVVLVSDGEDTCAPPDPCQVAKQLKAAGTDLVVHTIGFKVGAAARAQLSCIASATGGTYREATSGASLGAVLANRVERAIRPYTAVGRPIRGGSSPADAPQVEPGQYLDTYEKGSKTVAGDGTVKYYAVRLRAGDTPYVSATLAPPGIRSDFLGAMLVIVKLVDADDDACVSTTASSSDVGVFGKLAPQTAVLTADPVGSKDWSDDCPPGSTVYVRVERAGDSWHERQLPMEISIRVEPPVTSAGPPAATTAANLAAPAEQAPKPVEAGLSFNDAPELAPGTYSDSITFGETRYFRVPLEWGQRLSYRVLFPGVPALPYQASAVYVNLASPLRARLEQPDSVHTYGLVGRSDTTMSGSTLAPVRYGNRESSSAGLKAYSVDGDYYLVLDASYPIGKLTTTTVDYRLTVAVDGTAEPGPGYATDPSPSPSSPPAAADGGSGRAAISGPPGGWAPWIGAAVVGGLAVVGLLLAAVRRRPDQPERQW